MTERVVSAIQPKSASKLKLIWRLRRPNDLSAYDLCLRALSHLYSWTRERIGRGLSACLSGIGDRPSVRPCCDPCRELPLLDNCQSGMDGRSDRLKLRKEFSFFGWHSVSIGDDPRGIEPYLAAQPLPSLAISMLHKEMVDRAVAFNPNAVHCMWDERGWTYQRSGRSPKRRSGASSA